MYCLKSVQGLDTGKSWEIMPDREYVAGRDERCDIVLNRGEKTASRQHAGILRGKAKCHIRNLSDANPARLNGKPIAKGIMKPGDRLQLGACVLILEIPGEKNVPPSREKILPIFMGLALCLCILFTAAVLMKKDSGKQDANGLDKIAIQAGSSSDPVVEQEEPSSSDLVPGLEKETTLFKKGMFFYTNGKIKKAIAEWEMALSENSDSTSVSAWLLRANTELSDLIASHYKRGITDKKFMKYEQAMVEFKTVLQLSLDNDKDSHYYQNALEQIREIKGK